MDYIICPICGNTITANSKFCYTCGNSISQPASQPAETPKQPDISQAFEVPQAPEIPQAFEVPQAPEAAAPANPFGGDAPGANPFGGDAPAANPFGGDAPAANPFAVGGALSAEAQEQHSKVFIPFTEIPEADTGTSEPFAEDLPEWTLEPPQLIVRRKGAK